MSGQGLTNTKLTDFKTGDRVRYVPYHAHGDLGHKDCENGRVTSVNTAYVFVRFRPEGDTSEACLPDQLVKT
jgi:hypothetical protein